MAIMLGDPPAFSTNLPLANPIFLANVIASAFEKYFTSPAVSDIIYPAFIPFLSSTSSITTALWLCIAPSALSTPYLSMLPLTPLRLPFSTFRFSTFN